jgi:tRNA 2-thiouridine synthesizing protein D
MLVEVLAKGANVSLCGTCCRTRGIDDGDVVDGARMATIHDLADLVQRSDRALSF